MDLTTFLSLLTSKPESLQAYSVISFRAGTYAALFFAQLLLVYKKRQTQLVSLDLEEKDLAEVKLILDTSFLGQRQLYWLKNAESLDIKTETLLTTYLNSYRGPHTLFYMQNKESALADRKDLLKVELPTIVTPLLYKRLFAFFYPDSVYTTHFSQQLFTHRDQLTLNSACIAMRYHACAGQKSEQFFASWLDKLILTDKSLFTLSQYLFARQAPDFFNYWTIYKPDYPDEFWIAYWLEQVWQACVFVHKAQALGLQEAKKTAYRLPFSFINKDWKNYSFSYLTQAHQQLYLLDYNLKNGISNYGLDLWYNKFLL